MFKILKRLFSPYVNPLEKRTAKLLQKLTSNSQAAQVNKQLLSLMNTDLVVVNTWIEKSIKGYKQLTKSRRERLYQHAGQIKQKFIQTVNEQELDHEQVTEQLRILEADLNEISQAKLEYIMKIMQFLKPGDHYKYLETASFDKLLVDINSKQMQGDCNQIVTFYIYLYSQKYPIEDLQIKLLPGHVCLHFQGIDIEATSASFHKYQEHEGVLPITEIISTNLLDVHDYREQRQKVSERILLKSAHLAYIISSKRELVENNLRIAYRNLGLSAADQNDFQAAVFFLKKAGETKLIKQVYQQAAIYYSKQYNFSKAHYYAGLTKNRELEQAVINQEAYYYYQKDQFTKALKHYRSINNQEMIKACYQQQYNQLHQKVADIKTLKQQKRHKRTYKKMLKLAKNLDDPKLIKQLQKIVKAV